MVKDFIRATYRVQSAHQWRWRRNTPVHQSTQFLYPLVSFGSIFCFNWLWWLYTLSSLQRKIWRENQCAIFTASAVTQSASSHAPFLPTSSLTRALIGSLSNARSYWLPPGFSVNPRLIEMKLQTQQFQEGNYYQLVVTKRDKCWKLLYKRISNEVHVKALLLFYFAHTIMTCFC